MQFLAYIANLVAFVVGIIVLIRLFQREGALKAVLGFICMLYTFVWGWQHAKQENLTNIMWAWTAVIVISIIINLLFPPTVPTTTSLVLPLVF